ncbi:MAG: ABC transporter permease [Candidatus Diapherotrites archaeon]|uniref:ABC transporter permease n=1 Tax=Candidatus Iainarchaeum sp. TaxID=3101447 RepID=A0A8T4L7U2_9ARCH|nr:ABC transporter permease [Candidatus Diapherotrites archaeon]
MIDAEIFVVAFKNIRQQGLRSYLTLLGVIIGIASIVALMSIGEGLNLAVQEQFDRLGANTLFLTAGNTQVGQSGGSPTTTIQYRLKDADLSRIESYPTVEEVIPFYSLFGPVRHGTEEVSASIIGFDAEKAASLMSTGFLDVESGRMFDEKEAFVAVVGKKFAEDSFKRELRPRGTLEIGGKKFRIIGILKEAATTVGGGGPNTGQVIFVPEKSFRQVTEVDTPNFVMVKTFTKEQVNESKERIQRYLDNKYGEKNFNVSTAEQVLERMSQVLSILSLVLVGIAAVSLIVGGVGIMSSMVTAVLERTREIGVMKAIGATNKTILSLFLIEAAMIGGVGGIIGAMLGMALSQGIAGIGQSTGINLRAPVSLELFLGALAFSMLVGMVSGLYPAKRAADLDPVEALRYE